MPDDMNIDWTAYVDLGDANSKFINTYQEVNLQSFEVRLNTKQLINSLSGDNKDWVEQIEKEQETKYGNYDIFSATVKELMIELGFGEMWITFYFNDKGEVIETIGTGQGHKYAYKLLEVAKELFWSIRKDI